MNKYDIFAAKRRAKQYLSGIIFLFLLIAGWFFPLLGYFIPLCMLVGLAMGSAQGRKWCDWLCPRGSFYDSLMRMASPNKEIPLLFKTHPFRIAVLVFLMSVIIINLIIRWPDPYQIGRFFMLLLYATTTAGVILAINFHRRAWCSFCPIGSLINWTSRSGSTLKIDSQQCVECRLCTKVCPLQIKPYSFRSEGIRTVADRDCLRCGLCVAVCPKAALSRH
jgi:polyferredoxin